MKYLLPLLFLSTFLFSSVNRTVESVTYRTQIGTTIGLIELSDGSIWKWIPDTYSENYLRKWESGDHVIIKVINHPGFCLQNEEKPHYHPVVSLAFESYLLYPSIQSYNDREGILFLDDGTKWEIIYDFNRRTLHHWAIGDRIITVQGMNNTFELINLDIPHENRAQIERCMIVQPYDPAKETS